MAGRTQQQRHRKLLLKYKNDPVATQSAIVSFYEKKLLQPLDIDERKRLQARLDEALEKLGEALD